MPAEQHQRLIAALLHRAQGAHRTRKVLAERLVAQIPGLLLPQPPELPVDLGRPEAGPRRERRRQLSHGRVELRGVAAEDLDERARRRRRHLRAGLLRPAEDPRFEVLAPELELADLARRLDQPSGGRPAACRVRRPCSTPRARHRGRGPRGTRPARPPPPSGGRAHPSRAAPVGRRTARASRGPAARVPCHSPPSTSVTSKPVNASCAASRSRYGSSPQNRTTGGEAALIGRTLPPAPDGRTSR